MSLEQEVEAQNLANKRTAELLPAVIDWLFPFIGTKVVTAENYLVAKVQKTKPKFEKDNFRWYIRISAHTLGLHSDQYIPYTDKVGGTYKEVSIYLGSLDKQVLTQLVAHEEIDIPSELSVSKIQQARKRILELETDIATIKSGIHPF